MKRRVKLVIANKSNITAPIKDHKIYNGLCSSIKSFGDSAIVQNIVDVNSVNKELQDFTTIIVHGTWEDKITNFKREKMIQKAVSDHCCLYNKELIVLETALLTRIVNNQKLFIGNAKHHRIGLNHWLYNRGTFIKNQDPSRWHKLKKTYNLTPKPWKRDGDYVLIVLGFDADPSNDITSFDFINSVVPDIKKYLDCKILVRVHPLSRNDMKYMNKLKLLIDELNLEFDNEIDFEKSLNKTLLCVMYNSTSIFQTIYNGVPCHTNYTNFGYNISVKNIQDFSTWHYPDVEDWFVEMSWLTYTRQEIRDKNFWPFIVGKLLNENNNNN